MNMEEHIENALKDIKFSEEWETEEKSEENIKFWLEHMYHHGYIAALKWSLDKQEKI